jgi:hypothetical protein
MSLEDISAMQAMVIKLASAILTTIVAIAFICDEAGKLIHRIKGRPKRRRTKRRR